MTVWSLGVVLGLVLLESVSEEEMITDVFVLFISGLPGGEKMQKHHI